MGTDPAFLHRLADELAAADGQQPAHAGGGAEAQKNFFAWPVSCSGLFGVPAPGANGAPEKYLELLLQRRPSVQTQAILGHVYLLNFAWHIVQVLNSLGVAQVQLKGSR